MFFSGFITDGETLMHDQPINGGNHATVLKLTDS